MSIGSLGVRVAQTILRTGDSDATVREIAMHRLNGAARAAHAAKPTDAAPVLRDATSVKPEEITISII